MNNVVHEFYDCNLGVYKLFTEGTFMKKIYVYKKNSFKIILLEIMIFVSMFLYLYFCKTNKTKNINKLQERINILSDHFQLLNHWMEIKNEGKTLEPYFKEMKYFHIAIYGMAELANRLSEELEGTSIVVDYGIDWNVSCTSSRIKEVYFPEDNLPKTDAIIVTPYSSFDSIKAVLEKRVECPIISLEEVIWSV